MIVTSPGHARQVGPSDKIPSCLFLLLIPVPLPAHSIPRRPPDQAMAILTDHQRSTPLTSAELLTNSCLPPPTPPILPRMNLQRSIIHNRRLVLGRAKQSYLSFLPRPLLLRSWNKVLTLNRRPVVRKRLVLAMCLGPLSPHISRRPPPMRIRSSWVFPYLRRLSCDVQRRPLYFSRNTDIAVGVRLSNPPGRIIVEHVVQ